MAQDGSREIEFTNTILAKDEKNYHAWQHRQWAIKNFGLFEGELQESAKFSPSESRLESYFDTVKTTEELLKTDVYNNSAWNHRYFIIKSTSGIGFFFIGSQQLELRFNPYKGWTDDVRDGEIEFTLGKISIAQDNESSWSYLRAIIEDNLTKYQTGKWETLTLDGIRSRLTVGTPNKGIFPYLTRNLKNGK